MLFLKWILYPNRLTNESQFINKINTKVIFIVDTKKKTNRLVKNGLNFESIKKPITFFWKANLKTICYKYCNIRYDKSGIYGDRFLIYKIYKKDHNTNNHIYNIINYKASKRKRCLYDLIKYGNYINMGQENRYRALLSSYR